MGRPRKEAAKPDEIKELVVEPVLTKEPVEPVLVIAKDPAEDLIKELEDTKKEIAELKRSEARLIELFQARAVKQTPIFEELKEFLVECYRESQHPPTKQKLKSFMSVL